jgi:RNA polymerase sigma-70 factor (ECF subfamily)
VSEPKPDGPEALYRQAAQEYGAALERLAYAYEADAAERRDLVQEIHLALWRSFERFNGRCSLRTWVYRVAHNVATSHVIRQRRRNAPAFITLEEAEAETKGEDVELSTDREKARALLLDFIHRLDPPDRHLMLAYLEGMDAEAIGEVTGLSTANVWTKIHRIKNVLIRRFQPGGLHAR